MTKRAEPRPPLNIKILNNHEKAALFNFFEELMGYSRIKRLALSYLYNDGFRKEHWSELLELLKTSDKPLGTLYQQVTKQELSVRSGGMLWVFIHTLANDIFTIYLYSQVKAQAREGFLGFIYIGNRFGINVNSASPILLGSEPYTKVSKAIKNALDNYFEVDNKVFKARTLSNGYELKFGKNKVVLGQSGGKEKYKFKRLSAFVHDILYSKKSILEIMKLHDYIHPAMFKLLDTFNTNKVAEEVEAVLENMVVENKPIAHTFDALYIVFGRAEDSFKKRALLNGVLKRLSNYASYETLTLKKITEQKRRIRESNLNMLRRQNKLFKLLCLKTQKVSYTTFQIEFNEYALYKEWAEVTLNDVEEGKRLENCLALSRFFNHIVRKKSKPKEFSAKDIQKKDIIAYLDDKNTSENQVRKVLPKYRNFITFLQDREKLNYQNQMGILPKAPMHDVSQGIYARKKDCENYQPIPDAVHDKIMLYRDELDPNIKNAYILISETGIRPGELTKITPESLIEENGKAKLVIWQSKVEKAHVKKGRKPERTIPISALAITAFEEQVKISEESRKINNEDCIFIKKNVNKTGYSIIIHGDMRSAIITLIKRHNICNPTTGEVWTYSPYQLRVKLVVEMIENGASHEQLKAFMGHLSDEVLKKAYAMVEKLKLMDMNTEFFLKEFSINLSEEAISQFCEEDLKEIVAMLIATSRKMMYGTCTRHPVQGDCGKLHEAASCAPCENLRTDSTNRKDWEAIYTEQCVKLFNLRNWCLERGIKEEGMKNMEWYIVEEGMLWSYASVLFNMGYERKWHEHSS